MQLSLPLDLHSKLSQVRDRLIEVYGPQRDTHRHDPTTQFVKAMISSRTRDAVSSAAFLRVCASLPSRDALPDADPGTIATVIQDVTYAPDKAVHLVKAAQIIRAHYGQFDLASLADRPVEDAMLWLRRLPGIQSKVAASILNFSTLRKRTLAVDTHVLRVSQRLGLVAGKANFERAFRTLMRLVPDDWDADDLYELHWLIKMHGQRRCHHHRPVCTDCPLAGLCSHITNST